MDAEAQEGIAWFLLAEQVVEVQHGVRELGDERDALGQAGGVRRGLRWVSLALQGQIRAPSGLNHLAHGKTELRRFFEIKNEIEHLALISLQLQSLCDGIDGKGHENDS